MRQPILLLILLLLAGQRGHPAFAQTSQTAQTASLAPRPPEAFGYRRLTVMFGRDSVQVLLLSKPGEEQRRKPLLLWEQGSLPMPLVLYDERGAFPAFPFHPKKVLESCHLAIISKPGLPLTADVTGQNPNVVFRERQQPPYYCARNYLDYYVRRDEAMLRFLKKQPWVDAQHVVIGGHSQGTTVVAHLAAVPGLVTRAVYLSGNPLGRIMSMLALGRQAADTADVASTFRRWQQVVDDPTRADCQGDDPRNSYGFGASEMPELLRVRVPVFVGFGTRDRGVAGDDYLRLETIRQHRTNFTFR
jgi:pimeloyl-ACP methyl ester carboxylesterase